MATNTINIKDVPIVNITDDCINEITPKTTSDLENDIGYITSSGSVASATVATTATNLTGNSGVSAGTQGPGANISVGTGGQGSISIPYFTVNAQGLITSMGTRTLTVYSGCSQCSNCGHCSVTSGCSQCSNCSICSRCTNCSDCNRYTCNCQP